MIVSWSVFMALWPRLWGHVQVETAIYYQVTCIHPSICLSPFHLSFKDDGDWSWPLFILSPLSGLVNMKGMSWGLDVWATPFCVCVLPVRNRLIRPVVCWFVCSTLRCGHAWDSNTRYVRFKKLYKNKHVFTMLLFVTKCRCRLSVSKWKIKFSVQKVQGSEYFEPTVSSSSILTLSCLFSLDDNQFEMDIWDPVLPPVESYLLKHLQGRLWP